MCPIAESGLPGLSRTFCECSGGYVKEGQGAERGRTGRVGGADITLILRPGLHWDADLIVYFPKESVVAMGDLLLSESMPAVGDERLVPGRARIEDQYRVKRGSP